MKALLAAAVMFALVTGAALAQAEDQCLVIVSVHWPGHDLTHAQVRVHKDAQRQEQVGAFPATDAEGKVILAVPAGTYYLTVVVDGDNDGKLSPGDGLGFFGVQSPSTDRPAPLEIKDKAFALLIPVTLSVGEGGQLSATGVTKPEPAPEARSVTLSGALRGMQAVGLTVVYAVPKSGRGACYADVPLPGGDRFALTVAAGEYYVFAVQDANQSESVDAGDLVAVPGYAPELARAFPVTTLDQDRAGLDLALGWRLGPDGLLKATEGDAEGPQMAPETVPAVIHGAITGTDRSLAATVRIATDAGFTQQVGVVSARERFVAALPAGLYFLSVMADADNDGQPSPGDLLGFHGVESLRRSRGPQPLLLSGGELRRLDLLLCGSLDENLKPVPLN